MPVAPLLAEQTLKNLRKLLASEDRWVQGSLAVGKEGSRVSPRSSDACRWCLHGGLILVTDYSPYLLRETVSTLATAISEHSRGLQEFLSRFNDHETTSHKDVLEVIDAAILLCKKKAEQ